MTATMTADALASLRRDLSSWAAELGFAAIGVADIDLGEDEVHLANWLSAERHGSMHYMARHGVRRSRPAENVPGTLRVISARMDYWPDQAAAPLPILESPEHAYVSRYALGRDYHKVLRAALQALATRIEQHIGSFGYRVFVDSAPVLEKALARNAGLGWIGKHTNLIDPDSGSYFFLGEIYTDLPLPADQPSSAHCGSCSACLPACPTGAIVAPWQLDARRCISYLTIELKESIPIDLRPLIGNRIYGCDDCQLVCPWNKFARAASHPDLRRVRHGLDAATLCDLFAWSEAEFATRMQGSAIFRIGYMRWMRNIAVALGNALTRLDDEVKKNALRSALRARIDHPDALLREHVVWALDQELKEKRDVPG
jgi:epoxyqueuosine reductase